MSLGSSLEGGLTLLGVIGVSETLSFGDEGLSVIGVAALSCSVFCLQSSKVRK